MADKETFGEIIKRLLGKKAVARLQREADISYPHLHSLMTGRRDGKEVHATPEMVDKITAGLQVMGITVSQKDYDALIGATLKLPEGYKVVRESPRTEYGTIGVIERDPLTGKQTIEDAMRPRRLPESVLNLEPPENWDDWPVELKEAMAYTKTLSPESQRYVYQLWAAQAKAHAEIEAERQNIKAEVEAMRSELQTMKSNKN